MTGFPGPAETRFWPKVDKNGPVPAHAPALGPCWLWTASRHPNGYGQFATTPGHPEHAHRAAWRLVRGPIPDHLWVLHHCDNRPCVNPDHLYLGTRVDNAADFVARSDADYSIRNWKREDANPSRRNPEALPRGAAWHLAHCGEVHAAHPGSHGGHHRYANEEARLRHRDEQRAYLERKRGAL